MERNPKGLVCKCNKWVKDAHNQSQQRLASSAGNWTKNCRLNRQGEASKKVQSESKKLMLHVAEEMRKSKWCAEWGYMFLKANLLFLELKICGLDCHHYSTVYVRLQQFRLLGCILLTRGAAGEAGQERGHIFTVLQVCLGPWVTSFKFKQLDRGLFGQSSGLSCCRSGISMLSAHWILHWARVACIKGYVLHKICYFFPIHTPESGFSFEKWTLRKRRGH